MGFLSILASAIAAVVSIGLNAPLADSWTALFSAPSVVVSSIFFWSLRNTKVGYWAVGWFIGAVLAFSWIPGAWALSHGGTPQGAWSLFLLVACLYTSLRYAYARLITRVRNQFQATWLVVAWSAACVWTLESLLIGLFPWTEPVGIVYSASNLTFVQIGLSLIGYEFTALVCTIAVSASLVSGRVMILLLAVLAVCELIPFGENRLPDDLELRAAVHQRVRFDPSEVDPEYADLDVWPESACVGTCQEKIHRYRVAGRQRIVRMYSVTNEVVVADGEGRVIFARDKSVLAPGEGTRVGTPQSQGERAAVLDEMTVVLPICYEILDRSLVGCCEFNLGITVSSDVYDESGAASAVLSGATRLRAIEAGTPFIRVSNASYSATFSADGQPLSVLPRGTFDAVVNVPYSARLSALHPIPLELLACLHGALLLIGLAYRKQPSFPVAVISGDGIDVDTPHQGASATCDPSRPFNRGAAPPTR